MTTNELQELLQSWENIPLMIRHISGNPQHLDVLMEVALDDSHPENWRAVWMIDKIHEQHPELVIPLLPILTTFVLTTLNDGKRRHLLKLISLHDIPEEKMAELLNYCITVFSNAKEPVAVRVHAMQILFNIAQKEHDFTGELIGLIEHETEYHGSAGIRSRGTKILKKLYEMKN